MKLIREGSVSEYITDALIYLMKHKPYTEISITQICEKAGVTRMSFYRNFESKEDILHLWLTNTTNLFLEESMISYKGDTTEEYFTKLFSHFIKYQDICFAIYKADLIHLVKKQFDRVFFAYHKGEYTDYKAYFHAGGVYNIFLLWLTNGCTESPKQVAEKLTGILEK